MIDDNVIVNVVVLVCEFEVIIPKVVLTHVAKLLAKAERVLPVAQHLDAARLGLDLLVGNVRDNAVIMCKDHGS